MSDAPPFDVLVDRATRGDLPALEALMPIVYGELRRSEERRVGKEC